MYDYREGDTPLVVSVPHDGREIPDDIARRMTPLGRSNHDADWHVGLLYDFADALGATVIAARFSRYVVDLNRNPADTALYPDAANTGIAPTLSFDGEPLYADGQTPTPDEKADRIATYWQPYHERIRETLDAKHARFGVAVLYDAHSIRSTVPRLFDGRLPDFNLGTADGASADPTLSAAVFDVLKNADGYSAVRDARFKGGYITRTYGEPIRGIHALQLELSQATYMTEAPPWDYREDRAEAVRVHLRAGLEAALAWARSRSTE